MLTLRAGLRSVLIALLVVLFGAGVFARLVSAAESPVTIRLTGGKVLEGTLVAECAESLTVRLASGATIVIRREKIGEIVTRAAASDELARREARLTPRDAASLYALSLWCEAENLPADSKRLLWQTLEVDPEHRNARDLLGFHLHGASWLTGADFHRAQGDICNGEDRWVPRLEWEAEVQEAFSAEERSRAEALLGAVTAPAGGSESKTALAEFRRLPKELRLWTEIRGTESLSARERQFAIREIGIQGDRGQAPLLAHLAVTDGKRSVRDEALRVLKEWGHPDTALSFLPYLSSKNTNYRISAGRALNQFPDRRAVQKMIETVDMTWAGFGRTHFAQLVQRAFVKDYELVSGGTGLVVQEVADPVVDTFVEGVVLDIDVLRVEAEAVTRVAALQAATGQSYGMDFDRWNEWWAANAGKGQLASASAIKK